MEQVQLAEDESRIEVVASPRTHIDDVEALVDQVLQRNELIQNELRCIRGA